MTKIAEDTDRFVMKPKADSELVYRLWKGDVAALGVLYDRYASLVYSLALKGLQQVAEAEDLTQEVFLALARTRTYDRQRGSLAKYLTVLTRSRVIDRLRARATRQKYTDKYLNQWEQRQMSAESTTPMSHAIQQEQRRLVREALSTLKAHQREVLELSYYEGRSQRDIAEHLGIPLGTVKSWARRGLLQLREQLREQLRPPTEENTP